MRVAILMPAYDEGERLRATLSELAAAARDGDDAITVFVVDDGSRPEIPESVIPTSGSLRVVLARHPVNLGQGAAIETARRLALDPRFGGRSGFDAWVTMDSDGQHRATDALALVRAIEDGADVALGDRFAGSSEVPTSRRVLLFLARVFERWTTGIVLSDAHNGLRAFGPRAIVRIFLRQNRMAHATEVTRRIGAASRAEPLRVVEIPVSVRYTAATLAKGQRAIGAVTILVDLFYAFLFGEP